MFLPIAFFMKKLYLWAAYTTPEATAQGLASGTITAAQAHALNFKRPMLNPTSVVRADVRSSSLVLLTFAYFVNKWSLAARCRSSRRNTGQLRPVARQA